MAKAETKTAPTPAPVAPAPAPVVAPAADANSFFDKLIPGRREKVIVPPLRELTMLVYAEPGAGKTTLVKNNPATFVIATEPGQKFMTCPVRQIAKWAPDPDPTVRQKDLENGRFAFTDVVSAIKYQREGKKLAYSCAAVDIIDNLYSLCLTHVCRKKGLDYPPENDYGKTWKEIRQEWETWLRQLMTDVDVTFVTHCATDTIELVDNGVTKEIVRRVPTFKGNKAAQYLDGIINAMGYIFIGPDGHRYITFQQSAKLATKDRTDILGRLGCMRIGMETGWTDLETAYLNKAKEMGLEVKSNRG